MIIDHWRFPPGIVRTGIAMKEPLCKVALNSLAPDFALKPGETIRFPISGAAKTSAGFQLSVPAVLPAAQWRVGTTKFKKRQAQIIVVGAEDAKAFEATGASRICFYQPARPKSQRALMPEVLFKRGCLPRSLWIEGMVAAHYGHAMSDIRKR
jgi:hypothetical protein